MGTLFDTLYKASEEIKKELLKPTKKNELERQFSSFYDKIAEKAGDAASSIVEEYQKIGKENISINTLIGKRMFIDNAILNQKICAKEYKTLFGKEIKGVKVEDMTATIFNTDGSLKVDFEEKK